MPQWIATNPRASRSMSHESSQGVGNVSRSVRDAVYGNKVSSLGM